MAVAGRRGLPGSGHPFSLSLLKSTLTRSQASGLGLGLERRVDNSTIQKANIILGILNGSLPGAKLPNIPFPGIPGGVPIELPPVVAVGRKVRKLACPALAPL